MESAETFFIACSCAISNKSCKSMRFQLCGCAIPEYDRRPGGQCDMTNSFSRRDFFALAAAAFTLPASAFSQEATSQQQPARGQGQAQGRGQGRGQQPPGPPLELPFEATGRKRVWHDPVDHQC